MRAFIFSLDAFVAFTLALVAVYSLIFFSSIPSSYYYLLTQAHYLSRDTLYALSASDCTEPLFASCKGSVMDSIVFGDPDSMKDSIMNSAGTAIPSQFGYVMELSNDSGKSWRVLYDTAHPESGDNHANSTKRLSVSSQVIVFDYSGKMTKDSPNPWFYRSCTGLGAPGGLVQLLTCSDIPSTPPYGGGDGSLDIVPSAGIRLVRLTVFI